MYALVDKSIIKEYPYTIENLKQDNPQISFPQEMPDELLKTYGVYIVVDTDAPLVASNQIAEKNGCKFNADKSRWEIDWKVREKTLSEQQQENTQLKNNIVSVVQSNLDNFAKQKNYDSILSLCSYASSTIQKFKSEGQLGVSLRDSTWDKLYQILADVESGKRDIPTIDEILSELPALVW